MKEITENQQATHTAEIDNLFNRMQKEISFYENSLDGLKDFRLQTSLRGMLEAFTKLPLTPADKAYADHKNAEALEKAAELQSRVSQLEDITNGKNIVDPLQTTEYEQALLNNDSKKAAKLEAAARQLRMDRYTAAQQINALMPALTETRREAATFGRIAGAVRKSMLMQELGANMAVFDELLERLMPLWADMNRLCVEADVKAEHLYKLKDVFNLPQNRCQLAPGLERVMYFDLQRRPYF